MTPLNSAHIDSKSSGLEAPRPRIVYIVTSSLATVLLRGQLSYLVASGFNVTLVSSPGELLDETCTLEQVNGVAISIEREIRPFRDLRALWQLRRVIRHSRPSIVNVSTPKAALLGSIAALLAKVPCRVYTMRGLRLETETGWKRRLLYCLEWLTCRCAQRVICVSPSLRDKAVELGLLPLSKSVVLGGGSSNGVVASRFSPSPERSLHAAAIRRELGILPSAPVIGFIGRLTSAKGLPELVDAVLEVRRGIPNLYLLLLGTEEAADPLPERTLQALRTDPFIVVLGFVHDTAAYYHVMSVVALPTHREGFPNVLLEAQAAGKPVVTTSATGAMDAVEDGVSGLLVDVGDVGALKSALRRIVNDPELAARMGSAGRDYVARGFRADIIWSMLAKLYRDLLTETGMQLPYTEQPLSRTECWPPSSAS